jgi:hypothetical protein
MNATGVNSLWQQSVECRNMADANIEVLRKETYLKMLENAPGTRLFNSVIVRFKDSGKILDVLGDGENSCAAFVSSVMMLAGLLEKQSATVESVRKKLLEKKWNKVSAEQIFPGDVVFWEGIRFETGDIHEHVGFALSATEAVSTDYKQKQVVTHNIDFNGERKIELILRAPESAFSS